MAKTTKMTAVVVIGLAQALSSASLAEDRNHAGTLCNPNDETEAVKISRTQWGVQNNASTTANVQCGLTPLFAPANVSAIGAVVYDRHPTANVCCTFIVQQWNGVIRASAERCTSGTSPSARVLSWTPPTGFHDQATIRCSIPPVSSGALSHITSYWVTATP